VSMVLTRFPHDHYDHYYHYYYCRRVWTLVIVVVVVVHGTGTFVVVVVIVVSPRNIPLRDAPLALSRKSRWPHLGNMCCHRSPMTREATAFLLRHITAQHARKRRVDDYQPIQPRAVPRACLGYSTPASKHVHHLEIFALACGMHIENRMHPCRTHRTTVYSTAA
jgi:hypothetical protein